MPAIADKALTEGWTRAALIHGLDDATRSAGEAFAEAMEEAGIPIVATETYLDGDSDFAGQIARIIASEAEFIFLSTNGPTFPLVVRQLDQMDFQGFRFFRESPTADAVNVAGDSINGVMFVYPYIAYDYPEQADDPLMVEFLRRYYERWGEMPFHDAAYRAWDAMMALWHASEIAGSNDSASLMEAMHQVHFRGLGGDLDFRGGDHEANPRFRTWVMEEGRPVALD
jgi:branched-chain amino acid transport system substrate-binding protein